MKVVVPRLVMCLLWVGLLLAEASCGSTSRRPQVVLREYRISQARRALAAYSRLGSSSSDEVAGSLSPDGKRLLYADNNKGQFDVWVKDLTTGLPRRLTKHVSEDTQPAWAPDGARVVFVSMRRDAKGDLYLWDNGDLQRLSDSKTADAYPVFAPDGRSIYFASGAFGQPRVERLWLRSGKRETLGPDHSTHPSVSPDGKLLAFTAFDSKGRGQIHLLRLSDRTSWTLTTPDYASGFPTFSADGKRILFCRFFRGRPHSPRADSAMASLWSIALSAALSGDSPQQLMRRADQLTSDRQGVILPRSHERGVVITVYGMESLDLALIPPTGLLPPRASPRALWSMLHDEVEPWDKLLILRRLSHHRGHAAKATYHSAHLWLGLGQFSKAKAALDTLAHGDRESSPVSQLARIDLATLAAERTAAKGLPADKRARAALLRLDRLCANSSGTRVSAYCLLRTADMQRFAGQTRAAVTAYERLLSEHRDHREYAASARLQLGRLFAQIQAPDLVSAYYLSLFRQYASQADVLDQAANAIFEQLESLSTQAQIERLRLLTDRYAGTSRFVALASFRLARLYEQQQRLDLAIHALSAAIRDDIPAQMSTRLAFEIGRLSLRHSQALRQTGQHGLALEFYRKALSAYERVLRQHEAGSEPHQRAKRDYLRLALLEAAQLTRQGELSLADKTYRRVLKLDHQVVQAHRGQVGLARRKPRAEGAEEPIERVRQRYHKRLDADRSDFVAPYMLGFLETLRDPLTLDHLDRAQDWLERSIALRPRSPFGHMTLGWIHEMRERYFGQTAQGWLEEAISAYTQAHELNDAKADPQTEADLATNLANAFVTLGGAWKEALEFCEQRKDLGVPFGSREQEAFHRLSCGRAAAARGAHDQASRSFERALTLSRQIDAPQLRTQLIARLALNEHTRGHYRASSRGFRQVKRLLEQSGQTESLAGIERVLAYNALLAGNHRAAVSRIDVAEDSLDRHGTPHVANLTPVALTPNPSTLPLGLDALSGRYALTALRETAHENDDRLDLSLPLLQKRITQQQQRSKDNTFVELRRELWLLRNRLGLTALSLGDRATFTKQLSTALSEAKSERTGETGVEGRTLALELGLALNAADQLLDDLVGGRAVDAGQHQLVVDRLLELEQVCEQWVQTSGQAALSERLRLTLWTDLALLSLDRPMTPTTSPQQKRPALDRSARIQQAGQALLAQVGPVAEAVMRLQRVVDETDPSFESSEPEAPQEGPLAALSRPLSVIERMRWHVAARLNLARLAARWVPTTELQGHPSSEILSSAVELAEAHELGLIEHAVAAELAYRRRDLQAMRDAVAGLIHHHPLLLDSRGLVHSGDIRRLVMDRAVALAQQLRAPGQALLFAELDERREFVEQLVRAGPRGATAVTRKHLDQLSRATVAYRRVLAAQDPTTSGEQRATWVAELTRAEKTVRQRLTSLGNAAPEVARLLQVGSLTVKQLQQTLQPGELAVRAVSSGQGVSLAILRHEGPVSTVDLGLGLRRLRGDSAATLRRVRKALLPRLGQPKRLFVDLGLIDPHLSAAFRPKGIPVVQLVTLWQLADARRVRGVWLEGGTVAAADAAVGEQLAEQLGFEALEPKRKTPRGLEHSAARRGVVVLAAPVRFVGGSAANLLLQLSSERPGTWRLARTLGQPLRASLLVLPPIGPGPARRAQRMALMRLAHAMGVANLALMEPGQRGAQRLAATLKQLGNRDLATAATASRLEVFGDGGLDPTDSDSFARDHLKRCVFGGAKAFKAQPRRLPETVRLLEAALIAIKGLGDDKFLGGALLFLANAYGLQEDYPRAVQRMQQLVRLRREELDKAKDAAKAQRLKATANYVTALRQMAWLRLRNEQYDKALAVNAKTITIYQSVGRANLVRSAYQQRGVIAEQKGDFAEALRSGRKQLELAEAEAARGTAARLTAARAAIRVAQLQRKRFSRYRQAIVATRKALKLVPAAKPRQIASLHGQIEAATQRMKTSPPTRRKKLAQKLGAITSERKALVQVLDTRLAALLEVARIRASQGLYAQALRRAEGVLRLATTAGQPQDEALLEIANNQYYLGAYQKALETTQRGLSLTADQPLRQIQLLNARGTAMAALGRFDEALKTLRKALGIARTQDIGYEMAASHNNIGHALRLAGRPRLARESFEAALALDRKRHDLLGQSNALANRGLTQMQLELTEEAHRDLQRAHQLARRIGAPFNQLKALAGLARLQLQQGKASEALKHAQQGRNLARRLGLAAWLWRFLLRCGQAHLALEQWDEAQNQLEAGLAIVHGRPPQRIRRVAGAADEEQPEQLYDALIDLAAQRKQAAKSLAIFESLQARSLVDTLGPDAEQIPWPEATTNLRRIVELSSAIHAIHTETLRSSKTAQGGHWPPPQVVALDRKLAEVRLELADQNPRLEALVRPTLHSLAEIRAALKQRLPAGTAVVAYHASKDRLVIWIFDPSSSAGGDSSGLEVHTVDVPRKQLVATLERYNDALSRLDPAREASRQLFDWMARPVLERTKANRWLVIAAGPLRRVPLATLRGPAGYLVDKHTLVHARSFSALAAASEKRPTNRHRAQDEWTSFSWTGGLTSKLPFTAHESNALGRTFGRVRVFQGGDADRATFLREAVSAANLHVATHADYQPEEPLQSAIRLHDRPVTLGDVLALRLSAKLVVLSACETAASPRGQGHGAALQDAFRLAGALQVVSTSWRVSDLAAALLMKHFFRQLEAGQDPAAALRLAQLQLRKRFAHPAFWGGFRVTGLPAGGTD